MLKSFAGFYAACGTRLFAWKTANCTQASPRQLNPVSLLRTAKRYKDCKIKASTKLFSILCTFIMYIYIYIE